MTSLWLLLLLGAVVCTQAQNSLLSCPPDWLSWNDRCYWFSWNDHRDYDSAARKCKENGAILFTAETLSEHSFVAEYLQTNDLRRKQWYTSAEKDMSAIFDKYVWTAINQEIPLTSTMWIPGLQYTDDVTETLVVYMYRDHIGYRLYGLGVVGGRDVPRPFICEISRDEVYRVNTIQRDFDYGVPFSSAKLVPRGPRFVFLPSDTVILGHTTMVYLECVAIAQPHPVYKWTRNYGREVISADMDTRYTLTNGRLTIQNPTDNKDAGLYQCDATNSEGTTLTAPIQLSFATLGEFSNVPSAAVTPNEHEGAVIECPPIPSSLGKAVGYNWMRKAEEGTGVQDTWIRTELNTYIFISGNGKLYFSEVTSADNGYYYCIAFLTNVEKNQNYIGANQLPSRNSNPIELRVDSSSGGVYDPVIQDSFINVVPGSPVAGMDISLECFAYGTSPLIYTWTYPRWDVSRYSLVDHNRILKIRNVQLEDSGKYICEVQRGHHNAEDSTQLIVQVEAKPEFLLPLHDQHLDVGTRRLTWRCEARAVPFPMYTWYKNGELLVNSTEVTVVQNTLIIENLNKARDEGMYQCAANNSHGVAYSTGQLRILSVLPSFAKYPMSRVMSGAVGGTVVIQCRPEAAPFPVFEWRHNNGGLSPAPASDTLARIRLLLSGDLEIREITRGDQGTYECKATNEQGTDSNTTFLTVYAQTQIYQRPTSQEVDVNQTAFMYCQASYNAADLDLAYQWAFNGRVIDLDNSLHYRRGTPPQDGGLYITSAQYDHAGMYTCLATTQIDRANVSATLSVRGPPGEVAGLEVFQAVEAINDPNNPIDPESVTDRDILIKWTDPLNTHGALIDNYNIYGKSNYSDVFKLLYSFIPQPMTVIQGASDGQRRQFLMKDLSPGISYRFKIRAINLHGVGLESKPTREIVIPGGPPLKPPDNIGGGGGKVGTLMITWTPLPREDHNGWGLGYIVEFRLKPPPGEENSNIKWDKFKVEGNVGNFSHTVGTENFYVPYNVKIKAYNIYDEGPEGLNDTVYSAEEMPIGIPGNVYAQPFNESAMDVHWNPVPDNRANMRGRLRGYKINYWLKDIQTLQEATQSIVYGQTDTARIIGLMPDTWYTVNVMVFNGAGNSLKSEVAHQSTDRYAPRQYPINIEVYPYEVNAVRIRFRGLSTTIMEEPLIGYRIKYWRDTEDIRNALDIECEKRTVGIVQKIQTGTLYHVRVFGYSVGGFGKMSSPETLFSMMHGRVTQATYDPSTSNVVYVMHDYEGGAAGLSSCILALVASVVLIVML